MVTRKRKKPGKYDSLLAGLPRILNTEPAFQVKVNAVKTAILDACKSAAASEYAAEYADIRADLDDLHAEESELNVRLEAIEQLLVTQCEAEDIDAVRIASTGAPVRTKPTIYPQVVDKEKFRLWCVANGLEHSLQLWPSSMQALTKERLLAGEPEPDGVEVSVVTRVSLTR